MDTNNSVDISVVVPVYNSSLTLVELCKQLAECFLEQQLSYEIVLVDDRSKDNSWEIIESIRETSPCVIGLQLSKNFGQHNATLCGIANTQGKYIVTIDDDLQIPPYEVVKLVEEIRSKGLEMVYGIYAKKKHNFFRNFGSNAVNWVVRKAFKTQGTVTSFRIMTRNLANQIVSHKSSNVYLDGLIHWHTNYIGRVLVDHKERSMGKSGYSLKKLISLSLNLLFGFTTFPLRIVTYLGVTISFISFLIGMFFIFKKLFLDVPLGYTSVIVSIYFMSGVLLTVLGVISEYIGRIYTSQNTKPQYSVKSISK